METGAQTLLPAARQAAAHEVVDLRLAALAVLAGVTAVYALPGLIAPYWFVLALASCLYRFPARSLIAVALMAAAWATIDAQQTLAHRLPTADNATVQWIDGTVAGLAEQDALRTRVLVDDAADGRLLRLSWYRDAPALLPGDCVRVKAKLFAPHGSANPGGFDYEAWLYRNGIDASGYVRKIGTCHAAPKPSLQRLRALALQRIDPLLADSPMRGIVEALTLGAREHITDAQWQTLRATGTSHLVAISGLHIGLIAGLVFALLRWLLLRVAPRTPVSIIASSGAFAGAFIYAAMAGWALPTQRALVMVAAGLVAIAWRRDIDGGRALAAALIVVLVWHPASVLAAGFWLSFLAVAWLIFLSGLLRGSWWQKALQLQLGLVAGLMPLSLWFFGQASIASPLVNAVAIPAAGLFVPVLLACVLLSLAWPSLGAPLLAWAAMALGHVWPALVWCARLPAASFHHGVPGTWALLLAMAGAALFCMPRALGMRWCAPVLVLPLAVGWAAGVPAIAPGGYRVAVLDVGQGLASVVRTRHHTLVFDTGPAFRTGFDAGEMIVVPYLREVARTHVDTLVLSHGDMDHAGGAPAIRRMLDVLLNRGARSPHPCRAGQHWRWDGVAFEFLYPTRTEADAASSSNERSCVLRIVGAGGTTLMTGDIEAPGEAELVAREGAALATDVLVVAHHGSRTSSSEIFLHAARPRWALISSGWQNRWHFPASSVVTRLKRAGAAIANTANDGALLVAVPPDPQAMTLTRWRAADQRFWHNSVQSLEGGDTQ